MIAQACNCGGIIRDGICNRCRSKRRQDQRSSACKRGYGRQWRNKTRGKDGKSGWVALHPLCICCKARGRVAPTEVVDHITPHNRDRELFNDTENWQPLCGICHDTYKRRIEQRFPANQVRREWERFLGQTVVELMVRA
jgi:5-methylcytosine-specific restriction protein A